MTQLPDIESRIRTQESMTTMLHACFKELSRDMIASFQQEAKYHAATDRELDIRFRHIDACLDRLEAITATKEDLASLESRMATKEDLASLESRMATKEDLASLESRMATKEDLASLESRMATKEDLASLESRLKEDMASLEGRIKEDLASLEKRILDAFKQVVAIVDTRLPLQGR